MKSQQIEAYGEPLVCNESERPQPQGNEVLVKVNACGVCHSDVHLWEGYFDLGGDNKMDLTRGRELPFTLGHEIVGEVVAVGDQVTDAKIGDKRVVYPWIGCGECPLCLSEQEHLCYQPKAIGITVDGGFSNFVMVPHSRYLHDYGNVPESLACTYACSGVTAYSALKKVQQQVDGRELLIIGAGGVGLAGLAVAKAILNCRIIVADIDAGKRDEAMNEGADDVLDPTDRDSVKALIKSTHGGVAAVVDFVGSDRSAQLGVSVLNKGSTLVVVGLFGGAMSLSIPLLPIKNITIAGSYVGSPQDMTELMQLVRDGKINAFKVTERPLSCAHETLLDLQQGNIVGRVVLTPEAENE